MTTAHRAETPEATAAGRVSWEAWADVVVVGAGVAGLSAAVSAQRRGARVLTIGKTDSSGTATRYAQGGIAVAGGVDTGDSVSSHVVDTCEAGGGLCDESAVRSIVEDGPSALGFLESLDVVLDRAPDGRWARTREGGHSTRRIVHAGGDATGAEVQRTLDRAAAESSRALLHGSAVRVLTAGGEVVGLSVFTADGYGVVHAPAVVLATGGAGQLFTSSTNPPGATADGIALALDAGAEVADVEFIQFHPTVLFDAQSTGLRPLISEAVRGEGAYLVDTDGVRFMADRHPRADLAPRDIVSRSIAEQLVVTGSDHVLLDARSVPDFHTRFPTVTASCFAAGLDPQHDLLPVAPAAHYSCGGVVTDVWGRTCVPGLFAAGEVARTGMHGANRLASNSLLEGLVVGRRAGVAAAGRRGRPTPDVDAAIPSVASVERGRLQGLMTAYAGVVRDESGLRAAEAALITASKITATEITATKITATKITAPETAATNGRSATSRAREDAALTVAARVLVLAATARRESRGCHTRRDFPDSGRARSIRIRLEDGRLETCDDRVEPRAVGDDHISVMTGVN